jgi:lysophospholipase L1-like esterase
VKFVSLILLLCWAPGCNENSTRSAAIGSAEQAANAVGAERALPPVNRSVHGLIVVLGSSTSAGIGPKRAENAWVPRYKAHLAQQFPNVTLVNLAVGGQTTFHIQPSGYAPPPNRPAPVPGKNITAALALKPSAIIVNLPSNDQASNYPLTEQFANYERIVNASAAAHVPVWISTSQPRNFTDSGQLDSLMRARDRIATTFAPRIFDFWTPFAAPNGFIKASYDSGDGTHLNDAAHAILVRIVVAARIPEQFATTRLAE